MDYKLSSYARLVHFQGRFTSVFILFVIIQIIGCTGVQLPHYHAKHFKQYPNSQIHDDLEIAIHPIDNEEESEKHFGTDLISANILAVFIMVENKSSLSNFILLKENITLGGNKLEPSHGASKEIIETTDADRDTARDAVIGAGAAALVFIPAFFPLIFVGAQMETDAFEVQQNFIVQEIKSKILSPGEKVDGFVYFKLPETPIASKELSISIKVPVQNGNKVEIFRIPFKFNIE